jgi:hypothetical protein
MRGEDDRINQRGLAEGGACFRLLYRVKDFGE